MYNAITNIYSVISNDATLKAYVKQFTKGGIDKNFLQYPFVNVGRIEAGIEETGIGGIGAGGYATISVAIECATRSAVPEDAYYGNAGRGEKGILQLLDDIRALCRANTFNCTFTHPAQIVRVRTDVLSTSGEWIWVAECSLEGRRKENRVR
jgi:hypothetical protein